jgi:pimeloyl-ACP methyl ester carboxylesterase
VLQEAGLAALRALAERGARAGWMATPAGPLRYTVRGPEGAPPLLLLHGIGDSLAAWALVTEALQRRFRVHLIDLPGHGLSARPPDWRLATLEGAVAHYARELPAPIVLGHSLGGWMALRLVLRGAIAPSSLTLVNPGGAPLPRAQWEPFLALISARDRRGVENYLRHAFHRAPIALRLFPGEMLRALWHESVRGIMESVREEDFLAESALARLKLPMRLLWAERDRLLPEGTLDFFRRALPHAAFTLLPKAGHLPHLERPRALARALLNG